MYSKYSIRCVIVSLCVCERIMIYHHVLSLLFLPIRFLIHVSKPTMMVVDSILDRQKCTYSMC